VLLSRFQGSSQSSSQSRSLGTSAPGNRGFTLVELVVVIALIAILAALALPSYQDSVRKSRRAEAITALLQFAGNAERIFTETNSYTTVALPPNTDSYTFSFTAAVTDTTYSIRATPTTIQADDSCGTLTLTQSGARTHTGTQADCF